LKGVIHGRDQEDHRGDEGGRGKMVSVQAAILK
jgi:hypothetical protein